MGAVISDQSLLTKDDLLLFNTIKTDKRVEADVPDDVLLVETQTFSETDTELLYMPNRSFAKAVTPTLSPISQQLRRKPFTALVAELQEQQFGKQFRSLTASRLRLGDAKALPEFQLGEVAEKIFADCSSDGEMSLEQFVLFKQLCYVASKARYYSSPDQQVWFEQVCKLLQVSRPTLKEVFGALRLQPDRPVRYRDLYQIAMKTKQLRVMKKAALAFELEDLQDNQLITYEQVEESLQAFEFTGRQLKRMLKYVDQVESGFLGLRSYQQIYYLLF